MTFTQQAPAPIDDPVVDPIVYVCAGEPDPSGISGEVAAMFEEYEDESLTALCCGCEAAGQGLHLEPDLRWDKGRDSLMATRIGRARAELELARQTREQDYPEPDD